MLCHCKFREEVYIWDFMVWYYFIKKCLKEVPERSA